MRGQVSYTVLGRGKRTQTRSCEIKTDLEEIQCPNKLMAIIRESHVLSLS